MHFDDFFAHQYKPIINSSVLPVLIFLTDKRIDHITHSEQCNYVIYLEFNPQ